MAARDSRTTWAPSWASSSVRVVWAETSPVLAATVAAERAELARSSVARVISAAVVCAPWAIWWLVCRSSAMIWRTSPAAAVSAAAPDVICAAISAAFWAPLADWADEAASSCADAMSELATRLDAADQRAELLDHPLHGPGHVAQFVVAGADLAVAEVASAPTRSATAATSCTARATLPETLSAAMTPRTAAARLTAPTMYTDWFARSRASRVWSFTTRSVVSFSAAAASTTSSRQGAELLRQDEAGLRLSVARALQQVAETAS